MRQKQSRDGCRVESSEETRAEQRPEQKKRAQAQRRRTETRRKGAEAQSLKPAEFRAKEEI